MRHWKYWVFGVLPLVALMLAGIILFSLRRTQQNLKTEIARHLSAIKAAGQPVTTEDLVRLFPDPPKELDAAILLKPGLDLVHKETVEWNDFSIGSESLPTPGSPLKPGAMEKLEKIVRQNRPALQALPAHWPAGARIPNRFSQGFTNSASISLTHLNWLMEMLMQDCLLRIERNETDYAALDIVHCLRISQSLHGTLLMHGLKTYGERMSCDALERLLSFRQLDDGQLQKLSSAMPGLNSGRTAIKNLMLVHRCLAIWTFDLFHSALAQTRSSNVLWHIYIQCFDHSPFGRSDFLKFLNNSHQLLEIVDLPAKARMKKCLEIQKAAQDVADFAGGEWDTFFQLNDVTEARLRTAGVALAIERYRLRNDGELPSSLDASLLQIDPGWLQDPYVENGASLKYQKLPQGYLIYSVGSDGVDDEGRRAREKEHGDVVFHVPR